MTDTLPRRGIEDSMYPKPKDPHACYPGDGCVESIFGNLLSVIFDPNWKPTPEQKARAAASERFHVRPTKKRSFTLQIEFDPQVVSQDDIARQLLTLLMPFQEQDVDGVKHFAWRCVRTHLWDSDVNWGPRSD